MVLTFKLFFSREMQKINLDMPVWLALDIVFVLP